MPLVKYRDLLAAQVRFRELAMQEKRFLQFDAFLGVAFPEGFYPDDYKFSLTEDEARKVRMLLTPNSRTLFKAWVIKQTPRKMNLSWDRDEQ